MPRRLPFADCRGDRYLNKVLSQNGRRAENVRYGARRRAASSKLL